MDLSMVRDIQIIWKLSYINLLRIVVWTLNYVDCIFFRIDSSHMAHNPSNLKFYFQISEKHDQTFIFAKGVIKSDLFCSPSVCLSAYLSICLWDTFLRIDSVDILNFLHEDILPYILKSGEARFWKIVFFV